MTIPTKFPPPLPGVGISIKPVHLAWTINDLVSSDGHRLSIGFTCTVRVVDEPAERQLFTEAFSASPVIGSQAAVAHFLPALRSAGAELASHDTAQNLLEIRARDHWVTILKSAANETAFGCGVEIQPPFEVQVTSPSLQNERLEQMQRIAAERRSADRVGHLARAADLLRQWESLKADIPSITPGKLLEQINPADRGAMLDTLLLAGASSARGKALRDLWAVSGSAAVRIDANQDSPSTQLFSLPITLGPLRSIRSQAGKLLIGARSGAFIADPAHPLAAIGYVHGDLKSEYGFTAVTQIGNHLWACHREGGLVSWDLGQPNHPTMIASINDLGAEPKLLTETGFFAAGAKLYKLSANGPVPTGFTAAAPVAGLLVADRQLIVVDEAGAVALLDVETAEKTGQLNSAGRICSAALLPWLSGARLLLNCADGPIECIGLEDQLITRFAGGHTGMRSIAANGVKVAAMSNDRQRVLLWNAWDGRIPSAEIHVTSLTHHRIADLAFG